jgi:hypothetical protein
MKKIAVVFAAALLVACGKEEPQISSQCRQDMKCTGEFLADVQKVRVGCEIKLEDRARDISRLDSKINADRSQMLFTGVIWADDGNKIIRMYGDNAKFQNQYGAWQRAKYYCDVDVDKQQAIFAGFSGIDPLPRYSSAAIKQAYEPPPKLPKAPSINIDYDKYKVAIYDGPIAKDIIPKNHHFRTRLREALKQGVNFAGHYAVVGFGCGNRCISAFIIDVKTGQVLYSDWFDQVSPLVQYEDFPQPFNFAPDSTLFVIRGSIDKKGEGNFFLDFKNGKFELIKKESA